MMVFLKAAIFDLDGVIVNTVPLHFKAWKKMFDEYETNFNFTDYKSKVDGISRLDGAKNILNTLSKAELDRAAARKQGYFLEYAQKEGVKVYQGTIDLIKALRKKRVKIGVISASKSCHLILEMAKIQKLFDVEVNGNDITRSKPDPQIFLMALERLDVATDESVAFEDAQLGVESARRAELVTVGVDRHHDPKRLKKATIIVRDLSELNYDGLKELLEKERIK
ncbi:HAD family hydrolase [Candidatus Omnitrophota bacterium]